jgi:hypothetical protein
LAQQDIQISVKKPEECESLIISHEAEQSNFVYFEEKGIAKVYNKTGKLLNSFPTPANWDGKLENGSVIPGYYIVEVNGKHFQVTVLK